MKKIINALSLFLLTSIITSCDPTTSANVPIISDENTSTEVTSEEVPSTSNEVTSEDVPSVSEDIISEEITSQETTSKEDAIQIQECYVISNSICYFDLENEVDPYINVDEEEFYQNYTISSSYIDSYFRAKHGLLCGELIDSDGSYVQHENAPMYDEDTFYKNAIARFGVDTDGNKISYTINSLDDNDYSIYRGGIYTSLNDVCAYLFAFNELPKNYYAGASLKDDAYAAYGELARLNFNKYTGPSASKYQYEPYLKGQDDKTLYYRETDFGANVGEDHYYSYKYKYNSSNGRGPFRIVVAASYDSSYTYNKKSTEYSTPNPTELEDRYVYYTFNHYNDFLEYLNYYNGFANPFGNCTAGNAQNDYVSTNPPTERKDSILAIF